MPAYEPLEHPLTTSAQSSLRSLHQTHSLRKLKAHLLGANGAVTEMAGEINDRLRLRQHQQRKRHARREKEGMDGSPRDKDEQDLKDDELKEQVDSLTLEMEASTRKLIDVEMKAVAMEDALQEMAGNAVALGGPVPWPARTTNQQGADRRRRRMVAVDSDEDDDGADADAALQDGADDEQAASNQDAGLVRVFQKDLRTRKERHDARPKRQK